MSAGLDLFVRLLKDISQKHAICFLLQDVVYAYVIVTILDRNFIMNFY